MNAAIRSSPECAASDKMPRLIVEMPTMIFSVVIPTAATTEFSATMRFSARMLSSTGFNSVVDIQAPFSQDSQPHSRENLAAQGRNASNIAAEHCQVPSTISGVQVL